MQFLCSTLLGKYSASHMHSGHKPGVWPHAFWSQAWGLATCILVTSLGSGHMHSGHKPGVWPHAFWSQAWGLATCILVTSLGSFNCCTQSLTVRFRLSGGSGDSGAEDERYDKEEGAIYRKEKQDQEAAISGKDQEAAISGKDQEAAISGKNQEATISDKDQECAAAVGSGFVDDRQRWKNEG